MFWRPRRNESMLPHEYHKRWQLNQLGRWKNGKHHDKEQRQEHEMLYLVWQIDRCKLFQLKVWYCLLDCKKLLFCLISLISGHCPLTTLFFLYFRSLLYLWYILVIMFVKGDVAILSFICYIHPERWCRKQIIHYYVQQYTLYEKVIGKW